MLEKEKGQFHRYIFENSPNGYAYCRAIFDESHDFKKFEAVETNGAFKNMVDIEKSQIVIEKLYAEAEKNDGKKDTEIFVSEKSIWIRLSIYIENENSFMLTAVDITREKRDLAVKTGILNSLNDIIFILDEDKVFLDVFVSDENHLFQPKDKIIGKKLDELFPTEFVERLSPSLDKVKNGESKDSVVYRGIAEGPDKWYRAESSCFEAGIYRRYIVSIKDITEYRSRENHIRILSNAVEQSPVSIVITDLDGNIEYANPKAIETTGYSLDELKGQNPRVLKSGETPDEEYEALWKDISVGSEWRGVFHNKRKNGELYWESAKISPIVDEKGNIINYVGIKEDITEVKKAEDELRKFRTISDQANYGTAIADMDGKLVYVNEAMAEMHGWETEELLGKRLTEFHSESQMSRVRELLDKIALDGGFSTERICRVKRDGEVFPSLMSAKLILDKNGNPEFMSATTMDATELKQKETEINKLKTAIEQSPVAIVMTDLDGNIQYVSPAFKDITGYSYEDVLGKNTNILKSGYTKKSTYEDLWSTIKSGKEWRGEWKNRKKDGTIYCESITVTPIHEEDGAISGYLAVKEDVTKQKQAEEDRIAREASDKASEAKSAFLANMSHEIRTPLNAIIGFTQILKRDRSLSESQREKIDTIIRSGEHLMHLINEILDLSSIESGALSLNEADFNICNLLEDVKRMFYIRTKEKKIELKLHCDRILLSNVVGDEAKLRQVLINLVGNAVKFTDIGHVEVKAYVEPGLSGEIIAIKIGDTGKGISQKDAERIFEPFWMAEEGRRAKGTGLGLAISKKLVTAMGGKIEVKSQEGVGTEFKLSIPFKSCSRSIDQKLENELENLRLKVGQGGKRILIADDNQDNRNLMRELLEDIGFETEEAIDGEQAVQLFERWKPHCILMDIAMPVMDGYEATKAIRSMTGGRNVKIVAVTASIFRKDIRKILESGMDGYLGKPFRVEDLMQIFRNILGVEYEEHIEVHNESTVCVKNNGVFEKKARNLPQEVLKAMNDLLDRGNMVEFRSYLDDVEKIDACLGKRIRELSKKYDYESIRKLINGEEN